MYAVEARNLVRSFKDVRAVDGLSITVERGEIFGLVGPDGAGKTTTMRLLTGILDPTEGEAFVLGKHTVREAAAIHDLTGYMSQRFGLYPDLTVAENIHFYADIYGVPRRGREERIEELLAFSNMAAFRNRYARNLSGGMKQKLGLACALIHSPEVLFLDEPTNGVDPVSRRDFWRILYHLVKHEGVTVVVSTAYLDEAERCSRVALMHGGKLVAVDAPDNLKKLLPGVMLELRLSDARRAVGVLRGKIEADSVTIFGPRIHVATRTPDVTRAQIASALQKAHIALESIDEIEPDLENVFVALLGDTNASQEVHA
ncbi:MAG: ABC transporter ATP-binding protein [Thermoanaerobaculia bacterium]